MTELLGCNNDNLDETNYHNFTFREIFEAHDENVSDKWDNYLEIYDDVFHKFIGKYPNYLEIGVQNGGSLQIATKFFKNGNIYGVDVNPKVCKMYLGHNIKTYCFDIKNKEKIYEYFGNVDFDIILDDGSHLNPDIISAFRILFSKINPGGIYAVEDLHTSYWKSAGGGYLNPNAAIEFFKNFIDLLNTYHIEEQNFIENLTEDDKYIFEWLESITFHDSVVVIKKLKEARTIRYQRISAGELQPIAAVKGLN